MPHVLRRIATVAGVAATFTLQAVAMANPGLLHKHVAGAMAVPAMLPGQTTTSPVPQAVTVTGDGVDAAGAATSAAGNPGGGAGCPVMPLPDGMAVAGVTVDGVPVDLNTVDVGTVDVGNLPAGTVVYLMPAPGHHGGPNVYHRLNPGGVDPGMAVDVGSTNPGAVDPGLIDPGMVGSAGASPGFDPGSVDGMPPMVAGGGGDQGGRVFVGPPMTMAVMPAPLAMNTAQATSAAVVPTDAAARTMAGGYPNRAVGLRADALGGSRGHGRGVPGTGGSVVAVSGEDTGAVVQAGGATTPAAAAPAKGHDGLARAVSGGQPAGVPGSGAAPRWRDRMRFAWPGGK